jgi:hypothetical protein
MKAIHNAAMAVFCFVFIVVVGALLDMGRFPQG